MKRFLAILAVLIVAFAGFAAWAIRAWNQPGPAAPNGAQTVVLIAPHSTTHAISLKLARLGVVSHGLVFELDLRLKGLASQIKAGEYAIPSRASMAAIAAQLVQGLVIQHKLTAAEGLTSAMIWDLVEKDKALIGQAPAIPQEGTLLPETYLFTHGETRKALLARMAHAQQKFLADHWGAREADLPFTSERQAVILASIVEKESAIPAERRHIASVFINRLRKGMKLQSDPTIIYAITHGYPLGRPIRQSEIEAQTPYNTYVITGLPPTPICNPGKDSLLAALDPMPSADLYFVATGEGGHIFSKDITEHLRNVAALRAFERRQDQAHLNDASDDPKGATLPDPSPPSSKAAHGAKHKQRLHYERLHY